MARYMIDNVQSPIDFSDAYIVPRVLQNCKNLLMTYMGEVPYDRYRGFNRRLLDLPIEELNANLAEELDRVMLWEPNVEVVSCKAYLDKDMETIIECEIYINEEG